MIVNVVEGQTWASQSDSSRFKIIKQIPMYGQEWVYYINEETGKEYSCRLENFVSRFSPELNNQYSKGKI
jgi:hypothetical protein